MPERVHLFVTCLVDQFSPDAGEAVVETLREAGCSVSFDRRQTCCGQPAMNLGHVRDAREVAGRTMDLYAETEGPIVVPSGSCAATMSRHYPDLFRGTGREDEARAFGARVREWSEYLDGVGFTPRPCGGGAQVTVHPACHGLREMGIDQEPVRLLEAAGYEVVPLPRAESCCGFGGAFSVLMPEMSGAMLKEKLDCVDAAGAGTVASLDTGCLMHMRGGHLRRASCPRYVHVAELLVREGRDGSSSS